MLLKQRLQVQTPVVVARNEYGILAPISIPLAQTRQAVPANKTIADSVIVSNDTPAVETPAAQPAGACNSNPTRDYSEFDCSASNFNYPK